MKTVCKIFPAVLSLLVTFTSCRQEEIYYFGDRTFSMSVDMPAIVDVPAANPGQVALVVTTDAPYWIVTTPDWVTPNAVTHPGSLQGSVVCFTIDANYKNIATTTEPRSGEIKISGGRTYVTIPINQLGYEGWVDPDSVIGGIPNMEEFKDFVTAVNDGETPVRWMNANNEVELLTDLDLSEMEEWVPIGYVVSSGNVNNATSPKGEKFTGVFNGGGHTIKGFKSSVTLGDEETWGFFGYLDGATVKNLNLEGVDITLSATGKADAGVLAGTASRSVIENVKVSGIVRSTGGTANDRRVAIGGIAGFVFSVYDTDSNTIYDSVIRDCETDLIVQADCGSNVKNGATSVMYGGIAGFCTGVKETPSRVRIENCVSKGSMTMNLGRSSGIVATSNYGTILTGCTNRASQLNTFENGRIGQICCYLGSQSAILDCVNAGDLITTDSQTTTGAIAALMADDSDYIEGGSRVANTGTIIGANTQYLSLLCANNSAFDHISDVILSGKLGRYSADGKHKMYSVTNSNILKFIGAIKAGYADRITNISYIQSAPGGDSEGGSIDPLDPFDDLWQEGSIGGIPNLDEFKAFVAVVNAGLEPSRWMNANNEVELLTDLDLSGMGEWVPIGKVLTSGNVGNDTRPTGGGQFTGVFNGGGHTVRGFKASATLGDDETWGFFGYLEDATVKDLNLEGVDITLSATGKADAGVLVGTASRSVIENVKVSGVFRSSGTTSDSKRFAMGGIAGFVFSGLYGSVGSRTYDTVIRDCDVDLQVSADCGSNGDNGAAGVMYGGIAGFCTGIKDNLSRTRIINCVNKGSLTMKVGRSSGIVSSANYGVIMKGCTNQASHLNTVQNGRIGQICCYVGAQSAIEGCANEGDLITTDPNTTTGAIAALILDNNAYIEGGSRLANTGIIIGANTKYLSLLCANNAAFDHISNLTLSGKLGLYSADGKHQMYPVTSDNIINYIGVIKEGDVNRVTNITYVRPDSGSDSEGGSIDPLNPVDDSWHEDNLGGGANDLDPVHDNWNF